MNKSIDSIKKKLFDTAYMLQRFFEEKSARVKRKEYALKRLQNSAPIEQVPIDYGDTELGRKIASYRQSLSGHLTIENVDHVGSLVYEEFVKSIEGYDYNFEAKNAELKSIAEDYRKLKEELDKARQKKLR